MSQTLTTVALDWKRTEPSNPAEFEAHAVGSTFRAFRHRTDYGWSWFEIERDGKHVQYMDGTSLRQTITEWL